jgi:hypothetical protein
MLMEHLKPEEIDRMPLHLQVLRYLELWGVAQKDVPLQEAG